MGETVRMVFYSQKDVENPNPTEEQLVTRNKSVSPFYTLRKCIFVILMILMIIGAYGGLIYANMVLFALKKSC